MNVRSKPVQTPGVGVEACYWSDHVTFFIGLYSNFFVLQSTPRVTRRLKKEGFRNSMLYLLPLTSLSSVLH